jgi:alkaline phosphatase
VAVEWARGRDDVLIVVLGDHETGGLRVQEGSGGAGVLPVASWETTGHTSTPVPCYATGRGAGSEPLRENTDVRALLLGSATAP